jgi:hypothetical protein
MKMTRLLLLTLLVGASPAVSSCNDAVPLEVSGPAPSTDLLGGLGRRLNLLQCSPLPSATATQTIGPAGGALQVGPHSLTIPPGALSGPVTITATAPTGTVNSVQFQPEGLTFVLPASLVMSYANCAVPGLPLPKRLVFTDDSGTILEVLLSLDARSSETVVGPLRHFSHYAVAY